MKKQKKLTIIISISFVVFVLTGTLLYAFATNIVKDIGLWSMAVGGTINIILAIYICIDSKRQKKQEKRDDGLDAPEDIE